MDLVDVLRALLALVFVLAVAALALFPFVVLVDVLVQHRGRWQAIGRSKPLWALVVLFGSYVGAVAYLVLVRRDLMEAAGTVPPPRFPPPPPPPAHPSA